MRAIFILAILVLIVGCASAPVPMCPPEAAIVLTPMGPIVVPEGFFDDTENWLTEKELMDKINKQRGY